MSTDMKPLEDQNESTDAAPPATSGPGRKKKAVRHAVAAVLVIVLLGFAAYSSVHTVPAGSSGVVFRFGMYAGTLGSGMHLTLPFGIDRIETVPTSLVETETFGFRDLKQGVGTKQQRDREMEREGEMLTGDLSVVRMEWVVQYKCLDPGKCVTAVYNPSMFVRDAGETIMSRVVGDASFDYVFQHREEVRRELKDSLQKELDSMGSGIGVVHVAIRDIKPPDEVSQSFKEVDNARQERKLLVDQALADYSREVAKARGEAAGMVGKARGYALERVNRARGETARFTAIQREYRGAREVTRKRLYLETLSEVMPRAKEVIVVDGKHKEILPNLNIHKPNAGSGGGK